MKLEQRSVSVMSICFRVSFLSITTDCESSSYLFYTINTNFLFKDLGLLASSVSYFRKIAHYLCDNIITI